MKTQHATEAYLAPEAEIISLLATDVIFTSNQPSEEDGEAIGPWMPVD